MSRLAYAFFFVWIVLLVTTPLYAENYVVRAAISIAMFSTLALSWNIVGGYAGYPSLATAAFVGTGSYVSAILQVNGLPIVICWVLATLTVAVLSAVLGWLLLRLKGHYFAIGSIVLVELFRLIVSSWGELTGGGNGLNVPLLRWHPDQVAALFLAVMTGLMILAFAMNVAVARHRLGFGLRCIRQNEDAADMVGVNTTKYKVIAFVLSAFLCGTVGAVYSSWVGYIDPTESFEILLTLKVPVMALLGGAGTIIGPALGAAVYVILEELVWVNFLNWNRAILGALIVVLIFFLPNGILRIAFRSQVSGQRQRQPGKEKT